MKTALRHILCLISLFMLTIGANGRNPKEYDEKLNRYELLCGKCLHLRIMVAEGAEVSRTQATGLINDFVAMNKEIKAGTDMMSPSQIRRFEMINHWFSSGTRPMAMDHVPMGQISPALKGIAVAGRQEDAPIRIHTVPAEPRNDGAEAADGGNTAVRSRTGQLRTGIMAVISFPLSYGLRLSLQDGRQDRIRWGGYARFSSNFRFTDAGYTCLSTGTIDNGYAFLGNGNSRRNNMMATAGTIAGLSPWLDIYAGLGYGQSTLLWQDIEGSWASVQDFSHKGMAFEAGLVTSWRSFCIGIGISTIRFRTAALDLSVGVRF